MEEKKFANQTILDIPQTKSKGGNPNWHKGMKSPNPLGPGVNNVKLTALFTKAFEKDKQENGEDLFELAFRLARKGDTKVLVSLLGKCMPDLFKGEGFSDTELIVIREKVKEVLTGSNSRAISI